MHRSLYKKGEKKLLRLNYFKVLQLIYTLLLESVELITFLEVFLIQGVKKLNTRNTCDKCDFNAKNNSFELFLQ